MDSKTVLASSAIGEINKQINEEIAISRTLRHPKVLKNFFNEFILFLISMKSQIFIKT